MGSDSVHVHRCVPRGIHPSVPIEHGKVGTVHRVLRGSVVGVTVLPALGLTEAAT